MLARSTMNARQRPHVQVQPARRHHGLRTPCSRTSIIRRDGSGVSGPTATQQQQQLCDAQLAHVMPELVVGCATAAPAPLVVFAPASEVSTAPTPAQLTAARSTTTMPTRTGHGGSTAAPRRAVTPQHLASIDPDAANPRYNMPGLNGLSVGATFGLETVRIGCHTVWAASCGAARASCKLGRACKAASPPRALRAHSLRPSWHHAGHTLRGAACCKRCCCRQQRCAQRHHACHQQGCFTVTSQLPLQYRIQEVHGLLDVHNKVCCVAGLPLGVQCALATPHSQRTTHTVAAPPSRTPPHTHTHPNACAGAAAGRGARLFPLRAGPGAGRDGRPAALCGGGRERGAAVRGQATPGGPGAPCMAPRSLAHSCKVWPRPRHHWRPPARARGRPRCAAVADTHPMHVRSTLRTTASRRACWCCRPARRTRSCGW
jgi:hypothetical protein